MRKLPGIVMLRCGNHLRSLGFAASLPYVVWCLVGPWVHRLAGCCEVRVHSAASCFVAHEHGDHSHPHTHAEKHGTAPERSSSVAGTHLNKHGPACPFCDFARNAQAPATILSPLVGPTEGAFFVPLAGSQTAPLLGTYHPARGPPGC